MKKIILSIFLTLLLIEVPLNIYRFTDWKKIESFHSWDDDGREFSGSIEMNSLGFIRERIFYHDTKEFFIEITEPWNTKSAKP